MTLIINQRKKKKDDEEDTLVIDTKNVSRTQKPAEKVVQIAKPKSWITFFPEALAETVAPVIKVIKQMPADEPFLKMSTVEQNKALLREIPSATKKVSQDLVKFMFGLPIEFALQLTGKQKANIPIFGEVKQRGLVIKEQQQVSKELARQSGLEGTAETLFTILQPYVTEDLLRVISTSSGAFRLESLLARRLIINLLPKRPYRIPR